MVTQRNDGPAFPLPAPDLLEALIEVRAYLSKCPPHAEDITGIEWGRVMDLSGAALNKAEGTS